MFSRKKIKAQFMITIPEPCSEDWNMMTVVDRERKYCSSCEKNVVDFSAMSDDEIVLFFQHSNQKTCGRFSSAQLNKPYRLLPQESRNSHWWKAAMLLPLTLFTKNSSAQQNDLTVSPDSLTANLDTLEVVTENPVDSTLVVHDSLRQNVDSISVEITPKFQPVNLEEVTIIVGLMSYEPLPSVGFVNQQFINGGPAMIPILPSPLNLGCIYNPEPEPVYPIGVFPDSWSFWQWQRQHSAVNLVTTSPDVTSADPNEKKDDTVPPIIPETPWYEAILPPSLRPRRNG